MHLKERLNNIIKTANAVLRLPDEACETTAKNKIVCDYLTATSAQTVLSTLSQVMTILSAYDNCINEMRDENKLHGHITDSSAFYLVKLKPLYEELRVIAESNPQDQRAGAPPAPSASSCSTAEISNSTNKDKS